MEKPLEMGCGKRRTKACREGYTAITDCNVAKPLKDWGGRRESNPQQPEPQSGALPVELLPPDASIITGSGERREALGSWLLALGFRRQASGHALLWLNAEC